ncbi:MAG TPA: excinuclease ABC subunit UvrC [Rickettsiales bacterium]|nr:excinuclease ABC subunit UvrC [Rickettsiales bacterium]
MNGSDVIREYLKDMPVSPGVYRMLDEEGNVLYVGKAKNLKNRVSNYVSASGLSTRIMKMVSLTTSMEIVTTSSETEALLLESNLIKKLKPRYNILLRDDKSFPFILMTKDHDYPQITKHRGARDRKGEYFGPFASAGAVNETLTILQKVFLLRPCTDSFFKARQRPCLQYQIKRCSAPCVGYISKEEYAKLIRQAQQFLKGKSHDIKAEIAAQMQEASENHRYEEAAVLRDRIKALSRVQHEQGIIAASLPEADVIALYRTGDISCIQVFFFRGGQNFGNKSYFPAHSTDAPDAEILSAFISQFYLEQLAPETVLVNYELPDATLLEEAFHTTIQQATRGEKKSVMDRAVINAREALARHVSEHATNLAMLQKLADRFGLDAPPQRIEVYDNSHIAGTHMVGAMICASPHGFEKKHYRRFNIRRTDLTPGDDYAMMREVLTRRFTRLQKEDETRESWPDLVLIDGGEGQLSVATQVLFELGITGLNYAAIAKGVDRNAGREWIHIPGQLPFQLPQDDPLLHYLQRLRDEAHRFAIGSHRIKRSNAIRESALDQIPAIGAARKRALLQHFGSSKGVEMATIAELEKVEGISKKIAEKIYHFFRR